MSAQTTRYISRSRAVGMLIRKISNASNEELADILNRLYVFDNFNIGYESGLDEDVEFS